MRRTLLGAAMLWLVATLFPSSSIGGPPDPAPAAVTLIRAGSSPYSIVVPPDAVQGQRAAANELQTYLKKISGVELPIVDTPPGSPSIFIGQSPYLQERGIHFPNLAPEAFIIRWVGQDLVLGGRDTAGDPWLSYPPNSANTPSLFAVYTLLERYLGVRWYWPGELGEEVPSRDVVTLPHALELEESPDFEERFVSVGPDKLEQRQWARRNRLGSSLKLDHQHNWFRILPEKTYLQAHPEYFALVNGIRGSRGGPPGFRHQVCTTHPGVVSIFSDAAIGFFDSHPQARSFSLSPNDAGGLCECARCTALDTGTDARGRPLFTNRMFTFMNAVASRVGRRYPDRFLTTYAYDGYTDASVQLSLEPNLFVLDTYNFASTFLWDPGYRARTFRNMALWRAITPNTSFLSYYYFTPFMAFNLPQVSSALLPGLFEQIKVLGTRGVYFGIEGTAAAFGHDVYLIAHLAWDSHSDAEALLTDYYAGLFGPDAGPLVRRYHGLIQEAQRQLSPKLGGGEGRMTVEQAFELFRPLRGQAESLLADASRHTHTPKQQARLAVIRASWDYIASSLDALTALKAADAAIASDRRHPDPAPLKDALRAIEARSVLAQAHPDEDGLCFRGPAVLQSDKNLCSPFLPYRLRYHLEDQQFTATARRITLDRPDPEQWDSAPDFSPFVVACSGDRAGIQTRAQALYNDRALFIRIRATEPDADALMADAVTERDGPLWTENTLEVFVDPGQTRQTYYHLMTNELGTQFDQKVAGRPDGSWNGDWKVQVTRGNGEWAAVFEIPFATLEAPPPTKGAVWGLNLARQRLAAWIDNSVWAPTFGGLHRPAYFGTLQFQ